MRSKMNDRTMNLLRTSGLLAIAATLLTVTPCVASAETRIDLNRGWAFRIDPEGAGERSGWHETSPLEAERVDVPHTWNRGKHHDYLGVAWYFRDFDLPQLSPGATVQLNFGATFYRARVWVNGVEVGGHEGGYTAYSFDITDHLRKENRIAVAIDNRPGMATIPGFGARGAADAWYDWWAYGGIVRDVWLGIHGPVRIGNQFIRSTIDGSSAIVTDRMSLSSRWPDRRQATLRATVTGPAGESKVVHTETVDVAPRQGELDFSFPLADIRLWDLDHPNLYRLSVELRDADGALLDRHESEFGLRTIEIRNRHLLLNGERVRLVGMTRHADSPWEGLAETAGTLRHDYEDMKSLQLTLSRPVHYAPDPLVLEFADRRGVLLIPEIPVWQFSEAQLGDPDVLALAQRQMRELIEQTGNHPSVYAWSVANESATGTPAGIAYFRAMRDFIRGIDPGRPVTFADDNLPKLERAEQSAAKDADFLMMNQYFGAWHGRRDELGPALDKVNRLFPDKMVVISEFGFPGIFAPNAVEADTARASIIREQLPEFARRDWIAGAILWCYQDYKSRRYFWPGQEEGYLEHGLVDHNRQRKPSYFAWKEMTEPARVELRWTGCTRGEPAEFNVTVTPNDSTRIPYHPLRDYRVTWQLVGSGNRGFAHGERPLASPAAVTIAGKVPARADGKPFRLVVNLLRPDGTTAVARELASSAGSGACN